MTMLPIIARASDVVLRVVPGGLREAGLALGASQWQVIRRVVLPTARPGLATGHRRADLGFRHVTVRG